MTRNAARLVGPNAGARKYDLLTGLAVAALRGDRSKTSAISAISALRLIALITARYDWARDQVAIGHTELEALWGVSRRTVIREIDRLRALGCIEIVATGRRGRVTTYRLGLQQIASLSSADHGAAGPKFATRMAGYAGDTDGAPPQPAVQEPRDRPWALMRAALAEDLPEAAFRRWIAPLDCQRLDAEQVTLAAPSPFHADYLVRTYAAALRRAAARCGLGRARLVVEAAASSRLAASQSAEGGGGTPEAFPALSC